MNEFIGDMIKIVSLNLNTKWEAENMEFTEQTLKLYLLPYN